MNSMITIEILGIGCRRCQKMADNAEQAARELGLQYELFRVTEIDEIVDYDVLMTPALVIDGQVMTVGRVPTVDEMKELLQSCSP